MFIGHIFSHITLDGRKLKKEKKKVVRPLEKGLLNQLESLRLNSALFVPSLIEFGPIV